jgi:multicomponent Na+:H+ antiporter subunit B
MTIDLFIDIALFAFLAATAIAMLRASSLFAAAMLSGIFSLLCAGLYTVMDAVDVAFTEAAVGAGISTVLFLGTLALTSSRAKPQKGRNLPALATVLITGGVLIWSTLDMPLYGDPNAPIHHHVADRYINDSEQEVGPPNIVTSVLASYRGFDTMGETTVIFTAGMGVLLLLGGPALLAPFRRKGDGEDEDTTPTGKGDA